MPNDYEVWHAAAVKVARGRALQLVTVRPDDFLDWLKARKLPNTAATRLKCVEEKAARAGSETGRAGLVGDPTRDPQQPGLTGGAYGLRKKALDGSVAISRTSSARGQQKQ
jgi:hypothetical protein